MTKKFRTRKKNRKLLLRWAKEQQFSVTVTVLPRMEPRYLKSFTISIHRENPTAKSAPLL